MTRRREPVRFGKFLEPTIESIVLMEISAGVFAVPSEKIELMAQIKRAPQRMEALDQEEYYHLDSPFMVKRLFAGRMSWHALHTHNATLPSTLAYHLSFHNGRNASSREVEAVSSPNT